MRIWGDQEGQIEDRKEPVSERRRIGDVGEERMGLQSSEQRLISSRSVEDVGN